MAIRVGDAAGARPASTSRVIGAFNVQNLLGVLGVLLASDIALERALDALRIVTPPPGRMERLGGDARSRSSSSTTRTRPTRSRRC